MYAQLYKIVFSGRCLVAGILESLGKDRKLKPWMTNGEDLERELKRLGLKKEDLRLDKRPVLLDPANNMVDRVGASSLHPYILDKEY